EHADDTSSTRCTVSAIALNNGHSCTYKLNNTFVRLDSGKNCLSTTLNPPKPSTKANRVNVMVVRRCTTHQYTALRIRRYMGLSKTSKYSSPRSALSLRR